MHEHPPAPPAAGEPETAPDANSQTAAREAALRDAVEQAPRSAEAPRIWVGTAEDYAAATLHGRWIAAARGMHEVGVDIQAVLDRSPYGRGHGVVPQWQIFAVEGFGRHQPHPGMPLHTILARANVASDEADAYATWARLGHDDPAHCLDFAKAYQGRFDSLRDFVVLHAERAGYDRILDDRVPAYLRPFVDVDIDALTHEIASDDNVLAVPNRKRGGVWVFARSDAGKAGLI